MSKYNYDCCDDMEDFYSNVTSEMKAGIRMDQYKQMVVTGVDRWGYVTDWWIEYCPFCGVKLVKEK